MKRVIFILALVSTMFGADAQTVHPILFDQIGSTPQYTITVGSEMEAGERLVFRRYDAATKTATVGSVVSSLPAQTQFVTWSGSIIPVVGDTYTSVADTTHKLKKGKNYAVYDD
jgi:hypothetical protein